ncbi:ABC transporter substrate-binding protein [Erythrobacter insulae]|uniref:ABC transporter substrate-binding protein n=1 Tax=Erythrobacter insulae TaxID=2584124 RepID=A0A547PA53_9SPHN|nr:ABC transporter substrate-binding protein [Erythrobacter insulae]TRD11028.1 ABC transporter substrate-binding protein [Erythrobacter insulae]
MTMQLKIGFLPLVDACLPILAHEHGFAEEEGLDLTFVRDVSWATVLDRLLYGHSDAAHMLAPLAIATTLGRGRPAQKLAAPFVLGLNGNAVTVSNDLAKAIGADGTLGDPAEIGERLKDVAAKASASGRKLRFGVVHRYSSHNYMLRYWLSACGIRPDEDLEIVTIAPPFSADAIAAGEVDGSCVGEPWNSIAVEQGAGQIVLATAQIWRRGVEKVLALREDRLEENKTAIAALIRAMCKAGAHFVDPEQWDCNAEILSRPEYCDAPIELVRRAISDRLVLRAGDPPQEYRDFMFQYREIANFPWVSQAEWLYSQLVRWDGLEYSAQDAEAAARVFRPDIYRAALQATDEPLPSASSKVEGSVSSPLTASAQRGSITMENNTFFDHEPFDPDHLQDYIATQK